MLKIDEKLFGIPIAGLSSDANRMKRRHHPDAANTLLLGEDAPLFSIGSPRKICIEPTQSVNGAGELIELPGHSCLQVVCSQHTT